MASFVLLGSIVLLANLRISHGLICYYCSSPDPLSQCVINNGFPEECPYQYCTLYRVESSDGNNGSAVFLLTRGCTNIPKPPPNVTSNFQNQELKYYFRYCEKDFCNGGDGTSSRNPQRILVVMGKENSASKYASMNILLLIVSCLYQMLL